MATLAPPADPEADPRVRAVFDDIRATRGTDRVNNFWHHLAADPALLAEVWGEVKAVMAVPSLLEPKVKEMIYAAVSIAHACDYCTHSHLAAARARGMTAAEQAEFLRIVALAAKTNALVNAIRPPVDAAFLAGAAGDGPGAARPDPAGPDPAASAAAPAAAATAAHPAGPAAPARTPSPQEPRA